MNFRLPTISLSRDATFSRYLGPHREARDLQTAVASYTKLQNPSRMAPATPTAESRSDARR